MKHVLAAAISAMVLLSTLLTSLVAEAASISRATASLVIQSSPDIRDLQFKIPMNNVTISFISTQHVILYGVLANHTVASYGPNTLTTRIPISISVSVTGISQTPGTTNMDDVDFSWKYDTSDSAIRRFGTAGGKGHAVLRLYDDGWRVSDIHVYSSGERVKLTLAEEREEQLETRQLFQARAAQQARADSTAKYIQQRKHLSQTPTATLWSSTFTVPNQSFLERVVLTDVDLSFLDQYGHPHAVWFGDVQRFWYDPNRSLGYYFDIEAQGLFDLPTVFYVVSDDSGQSLERALTAALTGWRNKYNDVYAALSNCYSKGYGDSEYPCP